MVDAALGAEKQRQEGVVAPRGCHAAAVPDTREQLEVAQMRKDERVHEVVDAFFVARDSDKDERMETGHGDAIELLVPFPLGSILGYLDVEIAQKGCTRENLEELFDVGSAVSTAQSQVSELRPRQRFMAVGHGACRNLEFTQFREQFRFERFPGSELGRYFELL